MRILIGVDGSDQSDLAARLVAGMSWPPDTTFRIVSVVDDPVAGFGVPADDLVRSVMQERLDGPVARAASYFAPSTVEPEILRGRAAPAILEDARIHSAGLIVVGHRGQSELRALLLGSVAAEIVEKAKVPVLVARSDALGPIVLADDGSLEAHAAGAVVAGWPPLAARPVTVVSVAQVSAPLSSGIAATMRRAAAVAYADEVSSALGVHSAIADDTAALLRGRGVSATASATTGDPATAILAAAEEVHARLIVLGSRGRGGIAAVLGSVARAVVLRAPCSVLVVH